MIQEQVRAALAEDVGSGDATTLALVSSSAVASASMVAREDLVVAGLALATAAFRALDAAVRIHSLVREGDRCSAGSNLVTLSGRAASLLTAERVALNFVQRLSGIATLTARFVEAVKGTKVKILDTRKTTPGWRRLEKYAVACGGGVNHRFGLSDMILIKDNHLAALAAETKDPIGRAVAKAREMFPALKVEVEADTLEQAKAAAEARADIILLDNMTLAQLRAAVALIAGRCQIEASGGVNLDTVRAIAETGVDFISVGAITHSARAVDIALDFDSPA